MDLDEADKKSDSAKPAIDDKALRAAGIDSEELKILVAFQQSVEWSVMKKLLKYHRFQSDVALRNPRSSMEDIRHHQGRIGELNELTNFVETDLPQWYNAPTRSKGGR